MACLQIIQSDGSEQMVPLSKREPVTIGKHTSNTILLSSVSAPTLFARILWNKRVKGYEVAAASLEDIMIQGKSVRSAILKEGDEFSACEIKVSYREVMLSEESDETVQKEESSSKASDEKAEELSRDSKKKRKSTKAKEDQKKTKEDKKKSSVTAAAGVQLVQSAKTEEETSVKDWVKRARRPGERDAVRSPLITSLLIVMFLLAIAAGGFYLMIGKQTAQRAYTAAKADRDAGKFSQAIQRYSQFLATFSSHQLAETARIELSLSQIDRALSGAGTDIDKALLAVEDFVTKHRQRADYRDWYPLLATYSSRISKEAFRQAGRLHDPIFLKTGDKAQQLFAGFKASDGTDDDNEQELKQASKIARAKLLEFNVQEKTLAKMDLALKKNDVSLVLKSYREAAVRYPHFSQKKEFVSRVVKTLQAEQQSVSSKLFSAEQKLEVPIRPEARRIPEFKQKILLVNRQSSRFDIPSDGHMVWFLVDGSFFAVDRMRGEVRWQKEAGDVIPFEPMPINAKFESWMIPTHSGTAISLLKQEDGAVLWESTFPSGISSQPVLIGGMLYVLTDNRQLFAVEIETGKQIGQITFPRQISAPICLLNENELLCIGAEDVFYFIDRQTWKCTAVKYYGQAQGTISIQPQLIANRLVILESDQLSNGRMKVLRLQKEDWKMQSVQTERLVGTAVDTPTLWGDRLFLKTDKAVISAWHLTDTPGKALLQRITNAPIPFLPDTKIFMQPFEGDRLLIAGESLRELTLLTNAFEQNDLSVTLGQATQSLQIYGTNLSVAGETFRSQGRILTHYNFDQAESFWQLRLSSDPKIIFRGSEENRDIGCLDTRGNLFDLSRLKKQSNIMLTEPIEQLFESATLSVNELKIGNRLANNHFFTFLEREARLLDSSGQVVRSLRVSGNIEAADATSQAVYWANRKGIHFTAWDSNLPAVSSWLSPVQKGISPFSKWTTIIAVDDQTALALGDKETVLGLQVREDPRRHLGQSGILHLESKAINDGTYRSGLYWLALENGKLIAIDPRSLLIRQQVMLKTTPTAGPWQIGDSIYVEVDSDKLSARSAKKVATENWSLPLNGSPLAVAPFALGETDLFLSQIDGSYLIVEKSSGKIIKKGALPAPLSCEPVLVGKTLSLGLKTGTIVSIEDIYSD